MVVDGVSVAISVPPEVAFEVFTEEIGRWWRPGSDSWFDPARAIGMKLERGVGGRWLELYDQLGDDVTVLGEIVEWVPGSVLRIEGIKAFALRIEVSGSGSVVTVDGGDWETPLQWFQEWATWGSPRRIAEWRMPADGYILQPGEGVTEGNSGLKASRRSTLGSMTIMVSQTTGGAPRHVHVYDDEAFFVLRGTMTVDFDDVHHEVGEGGLAFIPRGVPHAWDTIGEATILIITAPGGIEEFLHELHTSGPDYGGTWRRIGTRYGYELLV